MIRLDTEANADASAAPGTAVLRGDGWLRFDRDPDHPEGGPGGSRARRGHRPPDPAIAGWDDALLAMLQHLTTGRARLHQIEQHTPTQHQAAGQHGVPVPTVSWQLGPEWDQAMAYSGRPGDRAWLPIARYRSAE